MRLAIGCGHPAKWLHTYVDQYGITHRLAVCGTCARGRLHPEGLATTTTFEPLADWLDVVTTSESAIDEVNRLLAREQPD